MTAAHQELAARYEDLVQSQEALRRVAEMQETLLEKRIAALTLPLDHSENIRFEELFNLQDIQKLQDDFSAATGVASVITRTDGTPITRPSNFCYLCIEIIRKTEQGLANCCKSDACLGKLHKDGPVIQPCLSGGLWDAGAGIAAGGCHIANWLIGQVRDETQTEAKMLEYAREIGADEKTFLEAFAKVPSMSLEKFNKIAKALHTLAEQLSTLAYQNIQQARVITERKQAEEAMRESEQRFTNAFNYAAIGVALAATDGKWLKVNASLRRFLGYSEDELLKMTVQDVTHEEDRDYSAELRRQLLAGEIDSYQLEKRYYKKSGQILWVLVSVSAVRNALGEPLYFVVQIEDISDRKSMEQELRMRAQKLEEIVAMRTQELFAANQELTAVNQELTAMNEQLTAMNEEVYAMNESLQAANDELASEVDARQAKERELLQRDKQYRATTSLLTRPDEDFNELLRNILEDAALLVGAPGGHIGLQDESGKNYVVCHAVGEDRDLHMQPRPTESGMLGEVYSSGEILCVEDYRLYPRRLTDPRYDGSTTVIMVPLQLAGRVMGALAVNWRDEVHPISAEDVDILRQFGVLASIAMEKSRAGERIKYQNQLLQGLADTTAVLMSELNVEKVLRKILDRAMGLAEVPHGFVLMIDEHNIHEVFFRAGFGRYESKVGKRELWHGGVFEEVLRTGRMIVVEDYVNWPLSNQESIKNGVTMSMHAPLKVDGRIIGDIGLTAFGEKVSMNPEKIAAFEQFAFAASLAIKNALSHQEVTRLAYHDTLTGLPNRAHLNSKLGEEMKQAKSGAAVGAVMFIDLDDLKTVNDHFGHSCGDTVIAATGRDIVGAVGAEAFVARVGGDEFVVILPGEEDLKNVAKIANRLVGAIRREYEIRGQKIHMSTSVGVTMYPEDGDDAEEILKNSDIAMYAAKEAGKNCWRFYEPEMMKDNYDKMVLTNSLRHALAQEEFFLHFQPQLTVAGRQVIGFEGLLRWNSKEHGLISPVRFIPLAEQRGLIVPIGQWVMREACRFAGELADLGRKDLRVAVNVSPRQLAAEDFVESVRQCICDAGIEPGQLEVEITENVLIDSLEDGIKKLVELSALGIHLSLDDFGTGFSSLTYLRSLPVGTLKIDKSFIDRIIDDKVQEGFVRSIVDMAHVLGLNVVAEGVETELQLLKLQEFGCDCLQGYVFSRPVSKEDALRFAVR